MTWLMHHSKEITSRTATLAGIGAMILTALFLTATCSRNAMWRDPVKLWGDTAVKSPYKGRPYHELGDYYAQYGDTARAFHYYQKTREVDPEYFQQGLLYAAGRSGADLSMAHGGMAAGHGASKAVGEAPANAHELFRRGLLDQALAEYRKFLLKNPREPMVHNNIGLIYAKKGLLAEASRHFSQAIQADASFSAAYSNLGFVHFQQGYVDRAIEELHEAVRLDARDAEPHAKLGLVYLAMGMPERSLAELEAALALDAGNATSMRYIGSVRSLLERSKR